MYYIKLFNEVLDQTSDYSEAVRLRLEYQIKRNDSRVHIIKKGVA